MFITEEFLSGKFLEAAFFESTKDRVIRGLRTYFESRRADSHAVYYRDALLAYRDNGIDESLQIAETAEFEMVKKHFEHVIGNNEVFLECLFTGNVSSSEARNFYSKASSILRDTNPKELTNKSTNPSKVAYPGIFVLMCLVAIGVCGFRP